MFVCQVNFSEDDEQIFPLLQLFCDTVMSVKCYMLYLAMITVINVYFPHYRLHLCTKNGILMHIGLCSLSTCGHFHIVMLQEMS